MSFAREKRWLLGLAALLAPLALPFNELLSWPVLGLYVAAVVAFLLRVRRNEERWLPNWAMNTLAIVYLPFAWVDFQIFSGGSLVRPVVHLLLFVLVARLFALNRERDKWQALITILFLFLAGMATSVHPTVVLYLVAFTALMLLVLTRFAFFHVLASFGHRDPSPALLPLGRFVAAVTVGTILVAAPLFALLPRIRGYYLPLRGYGAGNAVETMGFSDTVRLDSSGLTRENPEIVLRLRFARRPDPSVELRLKAGVHEKFIEGTWVRDGSAGEPVVRPPGRQTFELAPGTAVNHAELWLEPVLGERLALPVESLAIEMGALAPYAVLRHPTGTVTLLQKPRRTLELGVDLGRDPVVLSPPLDERAREAALDPRGITPQIRQLAAAEAGEGSDFVRARRLEHFFQTEFEYTTDLVGQGDVWTLQRFLDYRRGHCEYFATALTLMLRSQGIPARLATGFLGGELNPFDGLYVVRQLNAHAWVEAHFDDLGWLVLDPTPFAGRPASTRLGLLGLFGRAYDTMVFRWDRYIVAYGAADQMELFQRLQQLWRRWKARFASHPERRPLEAPEMLDGEGGAAAASAAVAAPRRWPYVLALAVLTAVLSALWVGRRTARGSAAEAYRALRRDLARRDTQGFAESLAPLALAARASERHPTVAGAVQEIVHLYLEESFAERRLDPDERRAALAALVAVRAHLKGRRPPPT